MYFNSNFRDKFTPYFSFLLVYLRNKLTKLKQDSQLAKKVLKFAS